MIDRAKIKLLYDLIKQDKSYKTKLENMGGKNKWNCVCSSIYWIMTAVSYFERYDRPVPDDDDNIYSINVYTYISCIDMIFEAICQLHRVFIDENTIPCGKQIKCFKELRRYDDENRIFNKKSKIKDDNEYFKMIRACFGAHPVNLKEESSNKEENRWFASFSTGLMLNDFGVRVYNNNLHKVSMRFCISFDELNAFLEQTYNYLDKIIDKVKQQKYEMEN